MSKMNLIFNFEGKVALVTGSSSGIGAATAIQFSKAGAYVVVTGRNATNVSAVAKQCNDVSPKKLKALEVIADVTKKEDLKRLVDTTIKTFGKLDILVNNAGAGIMSPITEPDFYEKYQKILNLNLNSVVYLTHLSVEHLEKTKGNIINVSSIASKMTFNQFSVYCVTKAGLDMFTKCMAAELGPKRIRVNVVNPGVVRTSFHVAMGIDDTLMSEMEEKLTAKLPTGRGGEPNDIAYAILFLASEESSYITGSDLVSDGGHLAANVPEDSKMVELN